MLRRHVKSEHEKLKDLKCEKCEKLFADNGNRLQHMQTCKVTEKPWVCTHENCHYRGKTERALKSHANIHNPAAYIYKCDACSASFATKARLKTHKTTFHQKNFPCTYEGCTKRCGNANELGVHIRLHHNMERPFWCEICNKGWASKQHYTAHVKEHHSTNPITYPCPTCFKSLPNKGKLAAHEREKHALKRAFACDQCEKTYKTKRQLESHVSEIHSPPKQCSVCSDSFPTAIALREHELRWHEKEKPYPCTYPDCAMCFVNASERSKHMFRRHEKQKLFDCLNAAQPPPQQHFTFVCAFVDGGTTLAAGDELRCGMGCFTQAQLQYHIQRNHTAEGLATKFESETKLAKFFISKGIAFLRDRENYVNFRGCQEDVDGGKVCARPDFFLPECSARLGAIVLVGNDEFAHRQTRCEFQRMLNIVKALHHEREFQNVRVLYVRFNPHFWRVDGHHFDMKLPVAHERLLQTLNSFQPDDLHDGLNLCYVNYDRKDGQLCVFAPENEDKDLNAALCMEAVIKIV
jgi:KRAB domain-containing zinc finger protein